MALIDAGKLRDYLEDYYGATAFNGFSVAMADRVELNNLSDYELCEYDENHGVDPSKFIVDEG